MGRGGLPAPSNLKGNSMHRHEEIWLQAWEEIWLQAWCATANAANCKSSEIATKYADACLDAFKQRFPQTGTKTECCQGKSS